MFWSIDDENYVIQGVGEFDISKQYPLNMFLVDNGIVEIKLSDLENFESDIDVFIYDSLLGTYTQINDSDFQFAMDAGDYSNRFYVTFQSKNLSTEENEFSNSIIINYLSNSDEIYIRVPNSIEVKQVYLMNMLGQSIKSWNRTNTPLSQETRIPVKNIAEGNYIIKVQTSDNRTVNKKVIVKQ